MTIQWALLVLAGFAVLIAIGLMRARSRVGLDVAAMAATETSNAGDIAGKAPGTLVELKGQFRCPAPITSEFAKVPCVWYRALTEREVEKESRRADGSIETDREFEPVRNTIKSAQGVVIADATGSVAVDFDGAKVEGEQVHRHTESAGLGRTLVSGLLGAGTLGYRYTEWIVAADVPVYLLGTVIAGGTIGKSGEAKRPFIISTKSEEERGRSLGRSANWELVGAIVAGLAAVGFVVGAFAVWGQ